MVAIVCLKFEFMRGWESEVASYVTYMDEKKALVMSCGLVGVRYILDNKPF